MAAIQTAAQNSANVAGNNNQVTISPAPAVTPENILIQIQTYVDEGAKIQDAFVNTNNVAIMVQDRAGWVERVATYLQKNIRLSTALQFRNSTGNGSMGCPVGTSINGCGTWQDIQGKKNVLLAIK